MDRKKYLLVTVDCETYHFKGKPLPLDIAVWGRQNNAEWGIPTIVAECREAGIAASFFVDVYAQRFYGEKSIGDILNYLTMNSQEIALHCHPLWLDYSRGDALWNYSLAEQIDIIKEGRDLIQRITGTVPVAFRAGAYGADFNTLKALENAGIKIDSSLFYQHPNCQLTVPPLAINQPQRFSGIWEIPVTVFAGPDLGRWRYQKLDLNSSELPELLYIFRKIQQSPLPVAQIFLHSFSFFQILHQQQRLAPRPELRKKLHRLLSILPKEGWEFVTFASLLAALEKGDIKGGDYLPHTRLDFTLRRFGRWIGRKFSSNYL